MSAERIGEKRGEKRDDERRESIYSGVLRFRNIIIIP